jgi:DNA polymerase-3 subunit gamma/tau
LVVEPPEDAVAPVVEPAEDLQALIELWPAVVAMVVADHALCGAVIADTRPVALADEDLTVGFPTSAAFLKKKAEDPSNRQIVTDALRRLAGGKLRISYELREDLDGDVGNGPRRTLTEEEWIERFKSELGAEEIPIEHEPGESGEPAPAGGERQEA